MKDKRRIAFLLSAAIGFAGIPYALHAENILMASVLIAAPLIICGALTLDVIKKDGFPKGFSWLMVRIALILLLAIGMMVLLIGPMVWDAAVALITICYLIAVGALGIPLLEN